MNGVGLKGGAVGGRAVAVLVGLDTCLELVGTSEPERTLEEEGTFFDDTLVFVKVFCLMRYKCVLYGAVITHPQVTIITFKTTAGLSI